MSGFGHLQFLPVVLCCFALIAFITSYILAVDENDVSALWPYISDAGAQAPQSCIFGQFLNFAAVIGFVVIFIRYKHVKDRSDPGMLLVGRLNYWSLWVGGLSCLGMSMVANFQVINSLPVHMVGAVLVFGLGVVYFWMQAIVSHKMTSQAISSTLSTVTRFVLSFLVTAFFIITGILSERKRGGKYDFKWTKKDPGYQVHLASTFSEWLMSLCFLVYFLTYFREFQKITVFIQLQPRDAGTISPPFDDDPPIL
ncbi:PREDICTED: DNA damage-regulated autophagy modulator protein 2-like isoform X2 [Acropora digitifera]|uniref:DNA damage-regulated autophagy modulator protein 2-like isoform X2 n=1 Tax=Acropora digitifera TaxID=70779 RepID=UPI00077B1946|nr:PREDICTED: DNA damage-regulated autophagy modulator protein 2-like isoform X2 [Acropora digitifera]